MPLVKNVWVKIQAIGAKETRADMAVIAAEARELGRMDPEIKVTVDRSALNYLSSVMGNVSRDLSKALGGIPGIGGGLAKLPTSVQIGLIAAALSALPFIAQAAAGVITLVLGGALTAIGVYAEMGRKSVHKQWTGLVADSQKQFAGLSPAFGEALTTILSAARTFIPQFIRDFKPALDAIAGPLKSLGVEFAGSLAKPEVADSLKALGQAFGGILRALTPAIPGIITSIADGFTNLFRAVARNPKAIADMITGLGHLIGILLDVLAWLTNVADYVEHHWKEALIGVLGPVIDHWHGLVTWFEDFRHRTAVIFDGVRHDIVHIWDMIWQNTVGRVRRGISDVISLYNSFVFGVVQYTGNLRRSLAELWDRIWADTVGKVIRGIADVVNWFRGLPGRIVGAVGNLGSVLFNAGKAVIEGFWNGLKSAWSAVTGWLSSIGGWISSLKGPLDKDLVLLRPHGRAIMTGLAMGMSDGLPLVEAQIARTTGAITGGGYGLGGGGGSLRIQWVGGPSTALEQALWTWFRERIRVTGGGGPQSVQRALGVVWR